MSVPSSPSVFVRFSSSFVGHREFVVRPPESEQFDYEAELAVVIGRVARRVSRRRQWIMWQVTPASQRTRCETGSAIRHRRLPAKLRQLRCIRAVAGYP